MTIAPEIEEARKAIREVLERLDAQYEVDEWGSSEGRLRDAVDRTFHAGRMNEAARAIAIEEIEDIYTCEHGVRMIVPCAQCDERDWITKRDRELVKLIAEGFDTEGIAEEMDLSRYTVKAKIRDLRRIVGGERMTDLPSLVARFDSR